MNNTFFNLLIFVTMDLLILLKINAIESSDEEDMDNIRNNNHMVTGHRLVTHNSTYLGYEVYWNQTIEAAKKPVSLCDQPCHDMYRSYGTICARNKDFLYRTFANPCQMLAVNCKEEKEWMITRRGKCYPYSGSFINMWTLWINKYTLPPDLQKVYNEGYTLKESDEQYYINTSTTKAS